MRLKQYSGQTVIFFLLSIFFLLLVSCSRCVLPGSDDFQDQIVFMSYNVQNIFDDADNGTEYPEFDPGGGQWGTSQYNTRLFNLSEIIRRSVSGGPDIIALQEIENRRVADDLVESYLKGMGYNHIIVTDTDDSAIQIGFISRLEPEHIKVHQIFLDGHITGRSILELSIITDAGTLNIFNNHWKSKLGGAKETEPARIAAGAVLRRRILELSEENSLAEIIVFGDLNENWDEYLRIGGEYITALMPLAEAAFTLTGPILITGSKDECNQFVESESIILYSPWCAESDKSGSYVYNDTWQTIDHI
ncbi:MAG: endonuclease/exonuclease/phosphatase family protein, partial [Spirochaetales bacterium]|nr:endonuclease/exonuclease/phosphatase family protein [Spirochaetales bacterium]